MQREQVIEALSAHKQELSSKYGSAARGEVGPDSDLNLLVEVA